MVVLENSWNIYILHKQFTNYTKLLVIDTVLSINLCPNVVEVTNH